MTGIHLCSAGLVFYPIYEDLREQKISLFPAVCLIIVGMMVKIVSGSVGPEGNMENAAAWIFGAVPGIMLFIISRIFGNCIGGGDIFLITGVGLLEGIGFCTKMLAVAGGCIFMYSMGMMAIGKLHRKSKVACVPFLALGYIGAWFL